MAESTTPIPPEIEFMLFLQGEGYENIKLSKVGLWAATFEFMFTYGIILGNIGDTFGYLDRWCYETAEGAKTALEQWDLHGEPSGWHRHPLTGRRKENGIETIRL